MPEENKDLYAEQERQDWSISGVIHRTIFRPFYMLYKEPILMLVTIYVSIVYGILYGCKPPAQSLGNLSTHTLIPVFEMLPIVFVEKRGFTIAQEGLMFTGVGIGSSLGALINFTISRHYPRLIKTWKGFPPAEERLYGAMIAGPCLVVGTFWLGWTGQYPSVPWYVPGMSVIFIGMSVSLVFASFMSYLVDTYV